MAQNDTANVSVGKGVAGGYFYTAPIGTALPSDYESAITGFENCGFITDEGITASTENSSETYKDLNGDDILTASSGRTRTIGLQFAEMNPQSLAEVFGSDNVSVDVDGSITVHHNNNEMPHRSIVMELVLRDGRKWRRVIEDAQVTDWDDMTVASSELLALGVTYTLSLGNMTKDFIIDYIEPVGADESE